MRPIALVLLGNGELSQGSKSTIYRPYHGRKENIMELQDFCMTSHIELTGWKAKIYDVIRRTDKLPPGEKVKTQELVNDLRAKLGTSVTS